MFCVMIALMVYMSFYICQPYGQDQKKTWVLWMVTLWLLFITHELLTHIPSADELASGWHSFTDRFLINPHKVISTVFFIKAGS